MAYLGVISRTRKGKSAGSTSNFDLEAKEAEVNSQRLNAKEDICSRQHIVPDASWIVGFTEGEGCFSIDIAKNDELRMGVSITAAFTITQHSNNRILLDKCQAFFGGIGVVRPGKKGSLEKAFLFRVRDIDQVINIIIPFFEANPMHGMKQLDFLDWKLGAYMIRNGDHLTPAGVAKLKTLAAGMNNGRYKKR